MSTTRRTSPPRRSSAAAKGTKATKGTTGRGRDGSPRRAPSSPPGAASSTRARGATPGAPAAGTRTTRPASRRGTTSTRASTTTRATTTRARTGGGGAGGTGPGRSAPTGTAPRSRGREPARRAPAAPPAGPTRPRRRRSRVGPGEPHRRAVTFLAVMVVLFALVGLRLVMVQVVRADYWASYGEDQRIRPIQLVAGRGAIFDRNGYDLAISVQQSTFVADPRLIEDPAATAATLAPVLGLDPAGQADLQERLGRDASFVYVARQVSDDVAERIDDMIEDERLTGIWSIDEAKRFNPAGELARSLLGRVGVDNEGLSALELQYDDNLSGEPGELIVEKDLQGRTIPAGRHHLDPAEPGEDLELTIDRNLQVAAEEVMIDAVREKHALGGVAIISDPETGEILALVNIERDGAGEPVSSGNNTAVTANYEPGSVNKVITLAAALEEGLVEPETELMVPGALQVADHEFTDSHEHPTEPMSVTDILTDSSNVGTILIAQELGKERMYDYLRDFGFGRRTALDFPQEVAGSLLEPDDWSGTSIGTIPIGHGVAVTAMQMLYAYNAIANDGVYLPPKLVDHIIDADGERRPGPVGDAHRVVSPTTAAQMRAMLANVVEAGTGEAAAIEGYQVAGKTGTARKPQEGGGYRGPDGRTHHVATFAGFMPADDPKLSVIVVLDEPRAVYASSTAAPAFAELSRYALRLLRVPPPAEDGGPTISVDPPPVRGQAADGPPPPPTTAAPATTPLAAPPTTPLAATAPTTAAGPLAGIAPLTGARPLAPEVTPADPAATAVTLRPGGAPGPLTHRSPLAPRARSAAPGRRGG